MFFFLNFSYLVVLIHVEMLTHFVNKHSVAVNFQPQQPALLLSACGMKLLFISSLFSLVPFKEEMIPGKRHCFSYL